jgi:hypothetical protein
MHHGNWFLFLKHFSYQLFLSGLILQKQSRMIVKSEPYSQLKPECFVPKTVEINPSTIKSQQMTSRSFIPLRIISDFMFYTFLSPYKIHFDKASGDFGMQTYFWHKVNELVSKNKLTIISNFMSLMSHKCQPNCTSSLSPLRTDPYWH